MIWNPRSKICRIHTYDIKSNMWGVKVDVLMIWNSNLRFVVYVHDQTDP
jgi:hypothetical protein